MNLIKDPIKNNYFYECSICNAPIGQINKVFKIGYEIDGIKYCKWCGAVARYSRAVRSHKST